MTNINKEFLEKWFVLSSQEGKIDVMQKLLDKGMNPDVFNSSALLNALQHGQIDSIKFLIENGSDYRQNDDFLFRKSITLKNPEFIQYLITKGVDVNANNGEILKNALKFSVVDPIFFDIAKILLDNGADFKLVEDEVISFIAYHYDEDTINFILKNIPDFNVHVENDILLRKCAEAEFTPIVKELIKRGANVHANNDEALEYACELGYFDLVKYLVEDAGANIFAEGRKAWQEASFSGHNHIVEYLDEREKLLKSQK